jgi:hypothetical protein
MTEELREALGDHKIWKNPSKPSEAVTYLGHYCPPNGQFFFTSKDLRDLGFLPGDYTVLSPEESCPKLFSRWQKITISE